MLNGVDPDQTPQNAASDRGLHILLRPVCPNTKGKYGKHNARQKCTIPLMQQASIIPDTTFPQSEQDLCAFGADMNV